MSSIERETEPAQAVKERQVFTKKQQLANNTKNVGSEVASIIAGPIIRHWTETIDKGTEIEYAPDFDDKFAEAVEDGCLFAYEANHASTYDAEILALVNDATREGTNAQETLLPMAKSQFTGDQGFWSFVMYKATRNLLRKRHLRPVATVTENDANHRMLNANSEEYATKMSGGIKNGTTAIAVLPEKSVEGGRINPKTGQLNGMIRFDPKVLRLNYLLAKQNHRPLAIEPVSIRDSYKVLNPETKLPGSQALLAGLHYGNPHIITVYVSAPIRSDRELAPFIANRDWKGASDFVAREIAKHLSPEQRGVYTSV